MSGAARRVDDLVESTIRSITVHALERGAINLGQGSPDFPPPEAVVEAAREALAGGHHQYAPTWGLPTLRRAIARKHARLYGMDPDPDAEVTVTCGVTEAIISALLGVVDPGDRVVILEPAHENYHAGVLFAGGEPVWVPLRPPHHRLDADELRRAFALPRVRALILNTPHNPTGRVFDEGELDLLASLCREHDVVAISDEIYEHMVYDGRRHVPLATRPGMARRTVTVSGLSKTYSVTGWRVGYAIAAPALTAALRKVHDFTTICAPTPLQHAAVAAMELPDAYYAWLSGFYHERRDRMLGILRDAGFAAPTPEGAYYTLADVRRVAEAHGLDAADDAAFVPWMIDAVGVGAVPGTSFFRGAPELGRGTVRFAFPKRDETLDEVERRFAPLRRALRGG